MALHADNAIVNGLRSGAFVWANNQFQGEPSTRLQPVNAYARNATTYRFAKDGNLLAASGFDPDLNTIVVNVHRWNAASSEYEHVAILKPKTGGNLNGNIEMDGNTVIAGSNPRAFIFDLPETFPDTPARFENFESGNAVNWTRGPGSQFSVFRRSTVNNVFRQVSVAGDAHAILAGPARVHQGVEADIIPWAFGCADCWVGLATRYVDPQNYYYVTLRHSGSVQLKRMRGGAFTTLASAAWPVPLHRTFRLRLDSMGKRHRVYIDGKLVLNFDDSAPLTSGNAAVVMYKAKADYDNVAVSRTPRGSIFDDDFNAPAPYLGDWTHNGPGQWAHTNGVLAQTSVTGNARALIGAPTADQSVAFRMRPKAYASTSNGEERWVGAIARYRDELAHGRNFEPAQADQRSHDADCGCARQHESGLVAYAATGGDGDFAARLSEWRTSYPGHGHHACAWAHGRDDLENCGRFRQLPGVPAVS